MGSALMNNARGGGRRGRRGGHRAMSDINVTPFVDVMLVLLIVFMVAAPLLTSGVAVDLPQSEAKAIPDEDNKPIEVTLSKDGKVYIGDTEFAEDKLKFQLQAMSEGHKEPPRIYVRADTGIEYGRVMKIIGTINGAGFSKVALISENKGQ